MKTTAANATVDRTAATHEITYDGAEYIGLPAGTPMQVVAPPPEGSEWGSYIRAQFDGADHIYNLHKNHVRTIGSAPRIATLPTPYQKFRNTLEGHGFSIRETAVTTIDTYGGQTTLRHLEIRRQGITDDFIAAMVKDDGDAGYDFFIERPSDDYHEDITEIQRGI